MTTMTSIRLTEEDVQNLDRVKEAYGLRNRTHAIQAMATWFVLNLPVVSTAPKIIPKKSRKTH